MQCHMVHSIPGRIRLRVPALKYLVGGAAQMEMYLQDQPGITAVRITLVCASVTVPIIPAAGRQRRCSRSSLGSRPR
jgi:hypothetical protein